MAQNKNQHFVPRIHFKPFTDNQEGNCISLYNARTGRFIHSAPTKNQCSRSYFYGKSLKLEHMLSELECNYAEIVQKIENPSSQNEISDAWLKLFWCAQWCRTEGAMREAKESMQGAFKAFGAADPTSDSPDHMWLLYAMGAISEARDTIADLGFCVIKNQSSIPFITSDDPAILTSRLHLVNSRWKGRPFGMQSAGALLLLPLSPSTLIAFYDRDVYSLNPRVSIKSEHDALALNEHQILKCQNNVYFSRTTNHEWIPSEFALAESQRIRPATKHRVAILDSENAEFEKYRVVSSRDEDQQREGIVVSTTAHKIPRRWPSFLKWHPRAQAFETYRGMGRVRRAFAEQYVSIKCTRIRI